MRTRPFIPIFAVLLAYLVIYASEHSMSDETAKEVHIWQQFFTGPWPQWEQIPLDRKGFGFSVGVAFRFLLVVFVVISIAKILADFVRRERREAVAYQESLRIRDALVKSCILEIIPFEDMEKAEAYLDAAFKKGTKEWAQEALPILFGKERAEEIIKKMEQEIPV